MRIVAGTHRGRRLETPADARIRPTADRIREALFNALGHRLGGFGGKRVLDAFAGTGALGLEALSRGAAAAVFMEKDRDALALCRRNVTALELAAQARLIQGDATIPPRADTACDLVLLDPPYGEDLGPKAMTALSAAGWIDSHTLIALETDRKKLESLPPGFATEDSRVYGRTRIALVRKSG